jgi:hypothetical protein
VQPNVPAPKNLMGVGSRGAGRQDRTGHCYVSLQYHIIVIIMSDVTSCNQS